MQGARKGRSVGAFVFSRAASGGLHCICTAGDCTGVRSRSRAIIALFKASTLPVSRAGYIRLQSVPYKAPGGGNICIVMKLR